MARLLKLSARLPVADLARTTAFYRGLGFEPGDPWPEDAPTFVLMERDAVVLQFSVAQPGEPMGHVTVCIDTDDALEILDRIKDRVTLEWGPEVYWYGRREFSFRDPDGYPIIISQETDEPPDCGHDS